MVSGGGAGGGWGGGGYKLSSQKKKNTKQRSSRTTRGKVMQPRIRIKSELPLVNKPSPISPPKVLQSCILQSIIISLVKNKGGGGGGGGGATEAGELTNSPPLKRGGYIRGRGLI